MDVPEKEAAIDRILEAVSSGTSLKKACKVEKEINRPKFYRLMDADKELADRYARARKQGWACMADEIMDIADDGENDYTEDEDGKQIVNYDHIQRSKVRIDTRKWLLSKMLPKTYGDKQEIKHEGTAISVNVVKPHGAD